jgi:hypothetical protein
LQAARIQTIAGEHTVSRFIPSCRSVRAASLALCLFGAFTAQAQTKPPQAQAWIDIATYSGFAMPSGSGANPLSALGGLFGGGARNVFGNTQAGSIGRWVDVTLYTRNNPSLAEAQQQVPAAFLSPALRLQSPKEARGNVPDGDEVIEPDYERPKGRVLLYWGCGPTVRQGQPKVLDMANAAAPDFARFFVSRRATQRGAHAAVGRPVWPSPDDARMVPANASLAGEHAFSGTGVPDGFRFGIPAAQDFMPALELRQADAAGATELSWNALPTSRAYFVAGMGANDKDEMVIWTSSEQPDTGFGLTDYQTNAAVDRWLKEKVLLAPSATRCTVPRGVFTGQGAMLRLIGYGSELNLAHPPRPADPKAPWAPVWAAKVRVKSVAAAVLGMNDMPSMGTPPRSGANNPESTPERKPGLLDVLPGIFGR